VTSVEIRVAPDAWTAGNPIIVFLRGGRDEEGPCDAGGGVTTGVEGVVPSVGATKPWIVGIARPCDTDGVPCDEIRFARPAGDGGWALGAGVTNGVP
jgi:hypothetical protein